MSLIRPLTRGLVQPINRSLLGARLAGDALTPGVKAMFASGEKGVMFDLTRAANLYTDSARTTLVTASGEQVGSATDLSPNAKHASSAGTARPVWNSAGYATFDAFDDYLQTAAIDFTATDAVTVVAAVRKLADASAAIIAELSANSGTNAGAFRIASPTVASGNDVGAICGGTSLTSSANTGLASPVSFVYTMEQDISSPVLRTRINGGTPVTSTATQGTGNLGNYALNIGARNATSLFFNGRIYRLLVIGRALTTTERNAAERWAAQPVGIIIP